MADQHRAVTLAPPPPAAVLTVMNVVMRPLLASPLGRRIRGVMLLEFRGRRTGRLFRVPVNFHFVDGKPMAFTEASWRLNFVGGAPVAVTHQGRVHQARATLVPVTPQEMAVAVFKSLETGGSAQRMGLMIRHGHQLSISDLVELGPALGTSVVTFQVEA